MSSIVCEKLFSIRIKPNPFMNIVWTVLTSHGPATQTTDNFGHFETLVPCDGAYTQMKLGGSLAYNNTTGDIIPCNFAFYGSIVNMDGFGHSANVAWRRLIPSLLTIYDSWPPGGTGPVSVNFDIPIGVSIWDFLSDNWVAAGVGVISLIGDITVL